MVAIKDMEMPLCCAECHISEVDCKHKKTAFVRYSRGDFARPFDCPLVEIVTCKDCKYWNTNDRYCRYIGNFTDEDFYCAGAKRRE